MSAFRKWQLAPDFAAESRAIDVVVGGRMPFLAFVPGGLPALCTKTMLMRIAPSQSLIRA